MNKLDYKNLEALPEWRFVRTHIEALIKDYTSDMVARACHGDVHMVMNLGGRIDALQEVLAAPESMMPGNPRDD